MWKKILKRILHHLARHLFPSKLRVFFHRLRGVNIGKNVFIGLDVHIDDDNPEFVIIEDDVLLSPNCILLTHKRNIENYKRGNWIGNQSFFRSQIIIKKGAHIGTGTIILPGVIVGEGALIGAGSVVTKDIPPYSLAIGVPAKVVKTFD